MCFFGNARDYLNIQLLDWIDGAGALGGRCSGFDGRTRQVKVLQVGGIVGRPLASRRFFLGRRPCFPASLLWRLSPRFFGFSSLRSTGEQIFKIVLWRESQCGMASTNVGLARRSMVVARWRLGSMVATLAPSRAA
jgi:hypothetical protein